MFSVLLIGDATGMVVAVGIVTALAAVGLCLIVLPCPSERPRRGFVM
jgi:hypothetical protein